MAWLTNGQPGHKCGNFCPAHFQGVDLLLKCLTRIVTRARSRSLGASSSTPAGDANHVPPPAHPQLANSLNHPIAE
jgi:hypothetical protein